MISYEHRFDHPTHRVNDGWINLGIVAIGVKKLVCANCRIIFDANRPLPDKLCDAWVEGLSHAL